jgi:hypothetical protein
MIAKNPISVFNLYEFLPSYGESSVSIVYIDNHLLVEILYDSDVSDTFKKITVTFFDVCFFAFSSYPGVKILNIENEKSDNMGEIIQYTKSEAAEKWSEYLTFSTSLNHYKVHFLAENKQIEIFSTGFDVKE